MTRAYARAGQEDYEHQEIIVHMSYERQENAGQMGIGWIFSINKNEVLRSALKVHEIDQHTGVSELLAVREVNFIGCSE